MTHTHTRRLTHMRMRAQRFLGVYKRLSLSQLLRFVADHLCYVE